MFSIIIPCHNYGKFLLNCIRSIDFENKYLNEILIVNDDSNDETSEIINLLDKKKKIKSFYVRFNSLSKTINFAVNKINTKYFSRIDPDDTYHQDFFDDLVKNNINDNFDYIYGDFFLRKNNKINYINQKISNFFKNFDYPLSNGSLISKKKFLEVGGIDESLNYKDDYDIWVKDN
jgi:glycosyltransferase involved in cell wall biosynthesis